MAQAVLRLLGDIPGGQCQGDTPQRHFGKTGNIGQIGDLVVTRLIVARRRRQFACCKQPECLARNLGWGLDWGHVDRGLGHLDDALIMPSHASIGIGLPNK